MVACVVNYRPHSRRTLRSFFSYPHSHIGPHPTFSPEEFPPFFSCICVESILQPFCFQIHACNGGCTPSSTFGRSNLQTVSTCFRAIPFLFRFFHTLLQFLAPSKNSTYLFSSVSTLCVKKYYHRGWAWSHKSLLSSIGFPSTHPIKSPHRPRNLRKRTGQMRNRYE